MKIEILFSILCFVCSNLIQRRIFNSDPSSIEYPHIAFIRMNVQMCTGAVITEQIIISSSKCFYTPDKAYISTYTHYIISGNDITGLKQHNKYEERKIIDYRIVDNSYTMLFIF